MFVSIQEYLFLLRGGFICYTYWKFILLFHSWNTNLHNSLVYLLGTKSNIRFIVVIVIQSAICYFFDGTTLFSHVCMHYSVQRNKRTKYTFVTLN